MAKQVDPANGKVAFERGSANVFAGLSLADAAELNTKLVLAMRLTERIRERGWTQAEAAKRLGNAPAMTRFPAFARFFLRMSAWLRAAPCVVAFLMSAFAFVLPVAVSAQDYPARNITFIVPYAAGGNGDIRGRQIAQKLTQYFGKAVVVENRAGAGGNIGTDAIARAAPDGYTIGMGSFAPMSVNAALFKSLPFNPKTDVLPVVLIERGPLVLMVHPSRPYKSVQDVVDAARVRPGVLSAANAGIGGSHHLSAELFKQSAGIDIISVPYKGGAPATTDLLAGNVDMMFEQMYTAAPSMASGKLRPLAMTGAQRLALFPNVPTFAEVGYPKVQVLNWQGVIVPAGTPAAIIAKLNEAVNRALKEPDLRDKILAQGNEVAGGTPQEYATLIASESEKWARVVRDAKIKPE